MPMAGSALHALARVRRWFSLSAFSSRLTGSQLSRSFLNEALQPGCQDVCEEILNCGFHRELKRLLVSLRNLLHSDVRPRWDTHGGQFAAPFLGGFDVFGLVMRVLLSEALKCHG